MTFGIFGSLSLVQVLQDVAASGQFVHPWKSLRDAYVRRAREVVVDYERLAAGRRPLALYTSVAAATPANLAHTTSISGDTVSVPSNSIGSVLESGSPPAVGTPSGLSSAEASAAAPAVTAAAHASAAAEPSSAAAEASEDSDSMSDAGRLSAAEDDIMSVSASDSETSGADSRAGTSTAASADAASSSAIAQPAASRGQDAAPKQPLSPLEQVALEQQQQQQAPPQLGEAPQPEGAARAGGIALSLSISALSHSSTAVASSGLSTNTEKTDSQVSYTPLSSFDPDTRTDSQNAGAAAAESPFTLPDDVSDSLDDLLSLIESFHSL